MKSDRKGELVVRSGKGSKRRVVPLNDDFSCHSLRHTFCKNLVDAGVSLEKIAALAGHDSLETTRRYCEPSPHDLALAVELIGEEG